MGKQKEEGFWHRLAVTLGCIPVYIPPGTDSFDALEKQRSARRAANSSRGQRRHADKGSMRRQQQAPPAKLGALAIPASPYSSKPPSVRHNQSEREPGHVPSFHTAANDSRCPHSISPKAYSSNGSSPFHVDSAPHDRDGRAHAPHGKSRSGPGASPLGSVPLSASGGIGRGRLQPGEDPFTYTSAKNLTNSRSRSAPGAEEEHGAASAPAPPEAVGASGPSSNSGGGSGADAGPPDKHSGRYSGRQSKGRRSEATQIEESCSQRQASAARSLSGKERGGAAAAADLDGPYQRADSGYMRERYVSDYYPSDTEHLVADSSYATAHIYDHHGRGQGQGEGQGSGREHGGEASQAASASAAQRGAGPASALREASAGVSAPPGDGVRDQMNAALARMRHNNSAPRHRGPPHFQVLKASSEHGSLRAAPRDDSLSAATRSPARPHAHSHAHAQTHSGHTPGGAGDAASSTPTASTPASRQPSHVHADQPYKHLDGPYNHLMVSGPYQHLGQSPRHQSPHRHALPNGGSATHADSGDGSFNSGSVAGAVGRQASATFGPGGHYSSVRVAELAVVGRQGSVAMSTGSGRHEVGGRRQQAVVSRTGSMSASAMNTLPLMSTIMLATRRFAGGAHRGGGDSGPPSRVGSTSYAPAGSGGSAMSRGTFAGHDPSAY